MMKKHRIRIVSASMILVILGILFLCPDVCSRVYAKDDNLVKNLLLIVEDDIALENLNLNSRNNVTYDLVHVSNLSNIRWENYLEIAAPISDKTEMNEMLEKQYECGKKVYLYGELTILDYCNVLGLDNFVVETKVENVGDNVSNKETAKFTFNDEYINSEVKNIVALKKNSSDGMLAKIAKNEEGGYELETFLNIMLDYVELPATTRGVTTIAQDFDFISSAAGGQYVALDWYLSKYSSVVNGYSYYAINTNVQAFGSTYSGLQYVAKGIYVNMSCPLSNDQLKDCGPASTENQSTIQVGLNFGDAIDSTTAGVSWSMNLTSKPDITCIENMSTDRVSWEVEKLNSSYNLENQIFKPGMTWCTPTNTAALDIQFRGYFESTMKGLWTYSDWENVYVRFLN